MVTARSSCSTIGSPRSSQSHPERADRARGLPAQPHHAMYPRAAHLRCDCGRRLLPAHRRGQGRARAQHPEPRSTRMRYGVADRADAAPWHANGHDPGHRAGRVAAPFGQAVTKPLGFDTGADVHAGRALRQGDRPAVRPEAGKGLRPIAASEPLVGSGSGIAGPRGAWDLLARGGVTSPYGCSRSCPTTLSLRRAWWVRAFAWSHSDPSTTTPITVRGRRASTTSAPLPAFRILDGRPPLGSLAENLRDLERHADDFQRRVGFTYTVLDDGGRVIGCVYIYPSRSDPAVAQVRSWVAANYAELDPLVHDASRTGSHRVAVHRRPVPPPGLAATAVRLGAAETKRRTLPFRAKCRPWRPDRHARTTMKAGRRRPSRARGSSTPGAAVSESARWWLLSWRTNSAVRGAPGGRSDRAADRA